MARPLDVRWASDSSLFLAGGKAGVFRLDLSAKNLEAQPVVLPQRNPEAQGHFFFSALLGGSDSFLAVGSPFGAFTWIDREAGRQEPEFPQASLSDLDVRGNRLVILGAQRGADGEWAPDHAIAWLGSLDRRLSDLKPITFSVQPHAKGFADCGELGLGVARFVGDGSVLILPGVEAGAYLYDRTGKLVRSWDTADLGIDTGCGVFAQREIQQRMTRAWKLRYTALLNHRRTLDDILDLPQGPGLVVRSQESGKIRWTMKILGQEGVTKTVPIPLSSDSGLAHLRGDVRGDRIAWLLVEHSEMNAPPPTPSKLWITEVP